MSKNLGIFGKLPSHGDFVERNVTRSFTTPWDDWLQRCIASSREQIGEGWLDYFLTSPIFRFALSPGSLDSSTWVGIMLPSVDSVGRYFPLTFSMPLNEDINLFHFLSSNSRWYENLESVAMQCLQESISADETIVLLSGILPVNTRNQHKILRATNGWLIQSPSPDLEMSFSALLQQKSVESQTTDSQSIWWTPATNNRLSQFHLCRGMPSPQQYGIMIGAPTMEPSM